MYIRQRLVSSPHFLWDGGVHLWLKVCRHSWPVATFLKSGVKRSKGAGTTPLMSQKLMCISLIHFVIIKERPDSQICRLDGYGVGLGITSGQNLASEPLGAGATRWSTC